MAENKKSFLLYTDVHHTVKKLTDEQSGKLFKHILAYVNDENPELNDFVLEIAFEPIKQNLKRDLRKYEIIRAKRSEAGKASADKRQQVLTSVEHDEHDKQVSTPSTVNDNVIVNVNVKKNKYSDFVSMFENEYQKLIHDHGEKNTKVFIEILNNYKGSSGKKYKSDYLTILNWVIDDAKKKGKYIGKTKLA
jgi:nitrous oxide reductase